MPLFNRTVEIIVGKRGDTNGISIVDQHTTFTVIKTADEKSKNTASVVIWNLSDATRKKIEEEDTILILKAGYTEDAGAEVIYTGDISEVTYTYTKPDTLTQIVCNDGITIDKLVGSISYKKGSSGKKILQDVLSRMNFVKKLNIDSLPDSQYTNGFAFAGQLTDALGKLANKLGFEWSIQDDSIKIIPQNGTDNSSVVLLTSSTGMIGSPSRLKAVIKKNKKKGQDKDIQGWKIVALLQPKLEPAGRVAVESIQLSERTTFRIEKVTHEGDNFQGKFNTTVEVVDVQ